MICPSSRPTTIPPISILRSSIPSSTSGGVIAGLMLLHLTSHMHRTTEQNTWPNVFRPTTILLLALRMPVQSQRLDLALILVLVTTLTGSMLTLLTLHVTTTLLIQALLANSMSPPGDGMALERRSSVLMATSSNPVRTMWTATSSRSSSLRRTPL
jgi:hypothetical protein